MLLWVISIFLILQEQGDETDSDLAGISSENFLFASAMGDDEYEDERPGMEWFGLQQDSDDEDDDGEKEEDTDGSTSEDEVTVCFFQRHASLLLCFF